MKYFNSIIIILLTIFVSSCVANRFFPPFFSGPYIYGGISESPQIQDSSLEMVSKDEPPVFDKEINDISEMAMIDEFVPEEESPVDVFDEEINDISEIAMADEFVSEEEPLDEIFEEIAETENTDDLIEIEQEVAADEPTTEIAALSDPVPPVQTTQPQPPVQPPAQTTIPPPPVQTIQPPVQQPPVQPTLPPAQMPSLLGSAEERNPAREPQSSSPPRDPLRDSASDSAARDRNINPGQTTVIPQDDGIHFSRVVRATVGQTIEIPFNGTGWVYLGELASRRGIVYNSRRLDSEGQTFIFRAEETGSYALKFYKQDFIRDYILNDHVQVIVGEAPAGEVTGWFNPPTDRGRVVAQPRWPSAIDEAEILRSGSVLGSEPPQTSPVWETPQNAVPVQPPVASQPPVTSQPPVSQPPVTSERFPSDVLLQRARDSFDTGNVAGAISLLDQYAQYYPETDELYWLYGQFYEANSPNRNILLSLDYYRRLVREYPQSTRYNDARSRIAYLERYYINIQ
jgi:hypothetical protein